MIGHERRKAAKKKQRPIIENYPDDAAPDEGAHLFRVEVLWLRGAEALQHLEAIVKFMAAKAHYKRWKAVLGLAEPLDRGFKWVAPVHRIGT